MNIDFLVEGNLDFAVATRLTQDVEMVPGHCYGKTGYGYIKKKADGFAKLAAGSGRRLLILVDYMDMGIKCVGEVRKTLTLVDNNKVIVRACVNELESWLLADPSGLARYLNVSEKHIPSNSEEIVDPKDTLLNIAKKSKYRKRREALVRQDKYGAVFEGPEYNAELTEYVYNSWSIARATTLSNSLSRAYTKLTEATAEQ